MLKLLFAMHLFAFKMCSTQNFIIIWMQLDSHALHLYHFERQRQKQSKKKFIIVVIRLFIVAGIQMTGCPHFCFVSFSSFLSLYISFGYSYFGYLLPLSFVLSHFILKFFFLSFSLFMLYDSYMFTIWWHCSHWILEHTPLHLNKCIYIFVFTFWSLCIFVCVAYSYCFRHFSHTNGIHCEKYAIDKRSEIE